MRPRTWGWRLGFGVSLFYRLPLGSRGEAPRIGQNARTGPGPDGQKGAPQAWARRPQAHDAEVNAADSEGGTPLMVAGNDEVRQLLRQHGAKE